MDTEAGNPTNLPTTKEQDEDRLAELGYKQELMRNWSLLHNFGVSFSIIVGRPPPSSPPASCACIALPLRFLAGWAR